MPFSRLPLFRRGLAAFLTTSLLTASLLATTPPAAVAAPVQPVTVWVDGKQLTLDPAPVIVQDRTLVPLRAIFSALGAQVGWDGNTRTVTATAPDGRYVRFQIGSRQACLSPACDRTVTLDVPAQIIADRTFVPVRFVAQALGATVQWDGARRAVIIQSPVAQVPAQPPAEPPPPPPAQSPLAILSVLPGQRITGVTTLRSDLQGTAARIKYILLDPATGRGPLLATGTDPEATYTWRPDPAYNGARILAAAVYDQQGRRIALAQVPVQVAVDTAVTVRGLTPNQVIQGTGGSVTLTADFGFVATRMAWSLVDPNSGAAYPIVDAVDPYAPFTWWPGVWSNGNWLVRATAYDRQGNPHHSAGIPVQVRMEPVTSIGGVQPQQTLTGPVTLRARVNYSAGRVQFRLADGTVLGDANDPAASFRWFPHPGQNGPQTIYLTVWDTQGMAREAQPVTVTVKVEPTLRLLGVGPRQVVTEPLQLRAEANVPLASLSFQLARAGSNDFVTVAGGPSPAATYTWDPTTMPEGEWQLRAVGAAPQGQLVTAPVVFRVYKGTVHGPRPATAREKFIEMISPWAVETFEDTGMSAALQVAQAVLETGYGQYVPVDKYSGQFSYNLFGIKGKGPAGSIISNTWEEYNGVAYRVDDYFRAYNSLEESWHDHQQFLLVPRPNGDRYAPFRAVMMDPVQGAWALRRTGYATDSRYALKLIDIMNRFNLYKLDEITP